ncbi:CHAT domain-containing protein [Algoriphagus sp. AGSA1]|uniref:CHAT domain-containing protein n=1 Tax=Algoriphagus sp. AGSA1 TaxID=2907213 RepID=UPI001F3DA452|nr:CHAT domain-containing tetratricopeptide repeat protein [Algoriphagus sp. AGSA1]MCE7056444.1 CHAT domain-containing protein [Algoriphagus sp. AGSA1]
MFRSIILTLFVELFISTPGFSLSSDTTHVLSLSKKGEALMYNNELDSAILILDSANSIIASENIAIIELVHGVKNRLAIALAYKQYNRQSIKIFQELKNFYQSKNDGGEYDIQIAQLFNNIAINYNLLFDYEQSIRYFDSSLVTFQRKNVQFDNQIRNLYLNKALNHLDLANYQSAIENLELSKLIRINNPENDPTGYEKMKENLAYSEVLIELNQNPDEIIEARNYLKENIAMLKKINPKDQYIGYAKSLLHKTYLLKNDYDSAIFYGKETIQFFKNQYGQDYTGLITKITDLGRVYSVMGEDIKAIQMLDSAIAIPTPNEIDKNAYKADAHLWKAKIHLKNNTLDLLQKELINATKLVFPTFSKSEDIFANPKVDSLFQSPIFSNFFIKKGSLLKGIYIQTGDVEYLRASLDAYILGINIGMRTRKGLSGLRAKSLFASKLTDNFDEALDVSYELYQKTKSPDDFWRVIWLSDLSKAASLKDKVNGKENISLGVPSYILSREIDLKSNLLYYEQAVYKESFTKSIRSTSMENDNIKGLINAKAEMESFMDELKEDYPKYYTLEYGSIESFEYNSLRSSFSSNAFPKEKLIIDFYHNKDYYLVSYISKKNQGVYKVQKTPELENAITEFHAIVSNKEKGDFQKPSITLYNELLAPALAKTKSNDLIIIPDGKLAYLPFDLLVDKELDNGTFKTYEYLIKKYTISYQYAYSLINKKQTAHPNSNSKVLAILPDFNSLQGKMIAEVDTATRDGLKFLTNLPFAEDELNNLSLLYKGDFLKGSEATESQFKAKAPFADIIHLATHSLINENNPLTSQLLFNGDETNDGLLHTYELFSLALNADLVTLSACNSGYGELQQGEGVISLARGFMYANVSNLLMSLWAVSDQSTSKLMGIFYKRIYEGEDYSQALRNAKLEYLMKADENTAHPNYWAGFVYLGDYTEKRNHNLIWIIALTLIAALIAYLFFKKSNYSL